MPSGLRVRPPSPPLWAHDAAVAYLHCKQGVEGSNPSGSTYNTNFMGKIMRKVPLRVACLCKDCNPGTTAYCWRCTYNPDLYKAKVITEMKKLGASKEEIALLTNESISNAMQSGRSPFALAWALLQ